MQRKPHPARLHERVVGQDRAVQAASEAILEVTNHERLEALVEKALRAHFRPEFLNRLDEKPRTEIRIPLVISD